MTYKAIVIYDTMDGFDVKEVILVPENMVKAVVVAVGKKFELEDNGFDAKCLDTIVCKSVKDLESKSFLFKG